MCNPAALVSFAVSSVSAIAGYQGEVAAANQQNALYKQNALNAQQAARDQYVQTQQRMMQEQVKGAEEKNDNIQEARAAKATAAVAAGESGVTGLSVDALLAEYDGRASKANDRIDENTDWTMSQLNTEMKSIQTNAQDRINSVQRAAKPSFFDAGLRIAAAGMDETKGYIDRNPSSPTARLMTKSFL